MTRRVKAMGPSKGKQRVLQSALILIASVAVAWITWERSCVLAVWLGIEGLFWVCQTFQYHKLNHKAQHPPNDDVHVRIEQFMSLAGILDIREFLSGWFMSVPFELLTREQVLDFVAYGFWYEDRSEMTPELQEEVKRTLARLEDKFEFHVPDVPEGPENKDLRFMCHLWEPLRVIHKPLMFIILMEACTGLSALILSMLGFTKYSTPTFTYWAKNVKKPVKLSARDQPAPVVPPPAHDHETPISEAIRRHSFSGGAVHRPSRTGEHWRRHQAALSSTASAGARQSRASLESVDVSLGGGTRSQLGALPGENTDDMAWSIWRKENESVGTRSSNSNNPFMTAISAVAAISFPSAQEMTLLFSARAADQIPESNGKLKESPLHPSRSGAAQNTFNRSHDDPAVGVNSVDDTHVANRGLEEEKRKIDHLCGGGGGGGGGLPHAQVRGTAGAKEKKKSSAGEAAKAPIVFLHGVGLGVLPYVGFIRKVLTVFPADTPVIVPEIVCELVNVLKRHQVDATGAHFIAHSFGTFVLSHTLHLYPSLVKSSLLCDPVCMLTCCPQLLRHFVYQDKTESIMAHLCSPQVIVKRMLGRDLIIAESFCRNFWWHTLMLWPNELPPVSVVCLSYDDDLVPCELVQKQLKEAIQPHADGRGTWPHVKSNQILDVILSKGPHGAFLALGDIQKRMLTSFRDGIQSTYG